MGNLRVNLVCLDMLIVEDNHFFPLDASAARWYKIEFERIFNVMAEVTGTRRIVADVIGYVIAVLLASLLFPQILKTHKHKHTLGLSRKTVILNVVIGGLGVAYSILIEEWPLLAGEAIACIFSIFLAILYAQYRDNNVQEETVQSPIGRVAVV